MAWQLLCTALHITQCINNMCMGRCRLKLCIVQQQETGGESTLYLLIV